MLFHVKYTDDSGVSKSLFMTANSEQAIRTMSAFAARVVSVRQLPGILSGVLIKKLPLESQLLLLSQVSTLVQSGGDASGIREIIGEMPELTGVTSDPRFRYCSTVTEYLSLCGVDTVTMMIVRSGEESGRLAESAEEAVVDIEKRIELKKATKGDVTKGVFYVVAGFSMAIGMSILLNPIILQLMEGDRIAVNFGTNMLLLLNNLFTSYILITAGVIGGSVFAIRELFQRYNWFRDIPTVKSFNNYKKVVRSLNFISTWRPLYLSGVPMMKAIEQVRDGMTGMDRVAMESMLEDIRVGRSLTQSLRKEYWSTAFRVGMKPFDNANDDSKKRLLFRIQSLLQTEVQTLGKKLGLIMLSIGMVAAMTGVLLMALGFYMPMLGGMKMF
jgi:type II secretory pathway component PulF